MVDIWRTKQDGSIGEGNHNVLFRVKSTCFWVDFARNFYQKPAKSRQKRHLSLVFDGKISKKPTSSI